MYLVKCSSMAPQAGPVFHPTLIVGCCLVHATLEFYFSRTVHVDKLVVSWRLRVPARWEAWSMLL